MLSLCQVQQWDHCCCLMTLRIIPYDDLCSLDNSHIDTRIFITSFFILLIQACAFNIQFICHALIATEKYSVIPTV